MVIEMERVCDYKGCEKRGIYKLKGLNLWYCREHYKLIKEKFKREGTGENTYVIAISKDRKTKIGVYIGLLYDENWKKITLLSPVIIRKKGRKKIQIISEIPLIQLVKKHYEIIRK